jgi:hypothetical protein
MRSVIDEKKLTGTNGLVMGVGGAYGNDGHEVNDHVDLRLYHVEFIAGQTSTADVRHVGERR